MAYLWMKIRSDMVVLQISAKINEASGMMVGTMPSL